jgi:glyoxylase-like metal-dependent hydrolase (beta-lactamase superfamily II)
MAIRRRPTSLVVAAVCALCNWPLAVNAQTPWFGDSLISRLRTAARSTPGPLPRGLNYLKFAQAGNRRSALVAGADTERVTIAFPVFQIRYQDRWIMIDAGFDRDAWTEFYGTTPVTYWPDRFDQIQLALRDAEGIVLTHEHWDHAVGIERGPYEQTVAAKTMLTPAQVASFLNPPSPYYERLARDSLPPFRTLSYDSIYPFAPGVALVSAPGHSPGSQWIYVQLATGPEFLIVGDLAWNMFGLERGLQRPQRISESLKEDREALQTQIDFVHRLIGRGGVTVIISHDDVALEALAARHLLHSGLDLGH